MLRTGLALLAVLVAATPAAAQSTYVGGSLFGEVARFGGVDSDDDDLRIATGLEPPSKDGETFGFDVRIGRALGERWGVELALARGGEYEQRGSQSFGPIVGSVTAIVVPGLPSGSLTGQRVTGEIEVELSAQQQHLTLDAIAWLRQELGDRVDLALLGGVSFSRVAAEQRFRITDPRLAIFTTVPSEIEVVGYGTGPVVGAEAIIRVSERAALTAGARLHGISAGGLSGWLFRPAVGLRWQF